jgi:hypothetical protein
MEKLEMDDALRAKLGGLLKHIELRDEAGQVIGHFLPSKLYDDLFYAALARETPYSPEELRRRHQEGGVGRSLKEIWKDLGRSS